LILYDALEPRRRRRTRPLTQAFARRMTRRKRSGERYAARGTPRQPPGAGSQPSRCVAKVPAESFSRDLGDDAARLLFPSRNPDATLVVRRRIRQRWRRAETAPVTSRGGRPRGATLPPRDFSPRETRTRAAAVTPRELFSPSTHVHPRIGSHGRTILVNGPAVQADEKEPSDLKGRRVIWDLELLEEMIGRLACTSCRGCPSGAHARGCSRGPRPRHPPA